ncbi:hypothetical protein [Nocardiopsis dassonvillei]|uniref:hypothetical protein n=1 Tax=Nocardiopsis dassonvillei TaxID=2014 RepID=UPI00363CCA26
MNTRDAMSSSPTSDHQMPARVLLLFGDQAELTTPERTHADPVRVPVDRLVADTGIPREELPGARLVAHLGADGEPVRFASA